MATKHSSKYLGGRAAVPTVKIKAQFGQELTVTVLNWSGIIPDRIRTQWGAVLKWNGKDLYEPE